MCARAGLEVLVVEADNAAAESARARIESSVERGVERGKLDAAEAEDALDLLTTSAELERLADRQLVIEAVKDEPQVTALDRVFWIPALPICLDATPYDTPPSEMKGPGLPGPLRGRDGGRSASRESPRLGDPLIPI